MTFTIHNGNCIDVMRTMPDNSVDSIVTDPPYELGFMGKSWDSTGIAFNVEVWQEALRVLKPGGHLLAFSGSRTYHRMAVAIEDAGFQIRDQIMWLYGSGFPKSLDVSKAIDKRGGVTANFQEFRDAVKARMKEQKIKTSALADALGNFMLSHYLTAGSQPAVPNYRDYKIIRDFVNLGDTFDHLFAAEAEREVVGQVENTSWTFTPGEKHHAMRTTLDITAPATPEAQQWAGWGTALKPAHEPIVLARKPLIGTVAANVLEWGTGGLNIDGSRVEGKLEGNPNRFAKTDGGEFVKLRNAPVVRDAGRFPANVIHDGLAEEWARYFYCAKASKRDRNEGLDGFEAIRVHDGREAGKKGGSNPRNRTNDLKVNHHPTVKPTDLMRYLVKLITPPNGTVLDPFTGSGSTGKGAVIEGFDFIGIELDPDYVAIATARIQHQLDKAEQQL